MSRELLAGPGAGVTFSSGARLRYRASGDPDGRPVIPLHGGASFSLRRAGHAPRWERPEEAARDLRAFIQGARP